MGSSGSDDRPSMHAEFMAFANDDDSLAILRGWALRQGFPVITVQHGGPDLFAQMLESAAPPKLVVLDLDGSADPVAIIQRLVSLCGNECKIVALGSANDILLYRRIVAAGAIDYLVKPIVPDLLNQAMTAALRGNGGGKKKEDREARVVVVLGARGGVGASTIALNAAWIMAHELNQNVALLDLDLQFGTSSLALDLEPGRGLRDIVSSPHRVDSLMIASSMVPESDNFSMLAAEETVDEFVPIDNAAITALLKEMRGNFDFIVVDLPRHLFATQKRLLAMADTILLVTELSLAGIRDTLRFRNALKNLECAATVTLVGARVNASHVGQVDAPSFEKGAQTKIDIFVPEDVKALSEASNSGKALAQTAKASPVVKALHDLATRIAGIEVEAVSGKGLLNKLVGDAKKKFAVKKDKP